MSLLKYIERLKRMDDLIRRRATGNPEEFSAKLNVSRSQLLKDIKDLKNMGAPIAFCYLRKTYHYTEECRFILDFRARSEVVGGKNRLIEWVVLVQGKSF